MIGSISSTGLTGLRHGLDYFESTAARISRTPSSLTSTTAPTTDGSASPTGNLSSVLQDNSPSLEEDMVDLLLAKRFIQGQVGVIQTEDEMLAEVVNLGRRRTE
jgi:hypothetical protein